MKIIICIMASNTEEYNGFKLEWIKNINYIKKKSDVFDFYFVYGGIKEKIIKNNNFTDIYYEITETIPNMLRKTLFFFEYTKNIHFDFLVRTNLSTLFDFEKMTNWFNDLSNTKFFGGSLIDSFDGLNTKISGTNMVFSKDIIDLVVLHQDRFPYVFNEDIELSIMVFFNIKNCNHKTISRIDFLENQIVFQKCKTFDNNVFCYRFKSNIRTNDIYYYSLIMKYVIFDKNILNITFINDYINGNIIKEVVPMFNVLSEKIWTIKDNKAFYVTN